MKQLLIALFALPFLGCAEEAPPQKPKKKVEEPVPALKPLPKPAPPPEAPKEEPPKPPPAPAVAKALLDPALPDWSVKAPDLFKVKFSTSKGDFTVEVRREWSPKGADRFYGLVNNGYYDDVRFFRVIGGFMAQFGIHGVPEVNRAWKTAVIADDPVSQSNTRGMLSYAMRGPNTRTVQLFINFKDNSQLDGMGFSPFAKVTEGMEVVDALNKKYGEGAPKGAGPDQMRLQSEGNEYLKRDFADLDYVKSAKIIP